jgi:hypothetical protein
MKVKSLSTTPSAREWIISQTANVGGDRMNPGIRIRPSLTSDERIEVRAVSCL